jgi:DNA-binding winged helix-turn-helix (wHTH) protein/tetratricopeptide (TPR) repeat protein
MQEMRFEGGVVLRPAEAQLLIDGRAAQLGGRAFEVLCALAEKPGQLVTKRELMDRVWPDVVVEENNLQVQISTLRRVLGPASIITVAGRGYRLIPERDSVASTAGGEPAAAETDAAAATVRPMPAAPALPLLERHDALDALARATQSAMNGRGAVCLVYGEAGIGKSSLCNAFLANQQKVRVLRGGCEALFSPRPLGPLYDFAGQLDVTARGLMALPDARAELFVQVLESLQRQPTIVLLEDLHWADAATLDLVKYLARRIHGTQVLLVLTYRDDELSDQHPLRQVLGDLQQSVTRVPLQPLSWRAVEELARQAGRAAEGILATTGGNPFYVTELLEAGGLPATVRDAVRSRVARQPAPVRALLELTSTVPGRIEYWVVEELIDADGSAAQEALSSGLLLSDGEWLRFRHELARRAVEQSIAPPQLRRLHARILECLLAHPQRPASPARLLHHAQAAGRAADVLRFAPLAAQEAAGRGAHREAASLYASALEAGDAVDPEVRARLLEACAWENHMNNQTVASKTHYAKALRIWQDLGRVRDQGRVTSRLARAYWYLGLGDDASRLAREAVKLLESFSDSLEYLQALSEMSRIEMLASRHATAIEVGSRALALAEQRQDQLMMAEVLNNIGTARFGIGEHECGQSLLERSLAIALRNRFDDLSQRGYVNLICQLIETRMYQRAEQLFEESGSAFFVRYDADLWHTYSTAWRSRLHFERGRWQEAQADADDALARAHSSGSVPLRIPPLLVIARLKAARGDPGADAMLSEVAGLAAKTGEPQRLVPAACARCELLWLERRELGPDQQPAQAIFERLKELGLQYYIDELGYWLWLHGVIVEGVDPSSVRGLQLAGQWRAAADAWRQTGCPLEEGQALLQGDEGGVAQAGTIFERLGATGYRNRARPASARPSARTGT